ncbi:hypothetical protein RchiOBHm_Chr7g0198611 [Rosa chinensis]|uniref:Uncharacterized protein n=1 Tax=Rosa chinensis TaxID=74649 RepID=A0A2P6P765_ROSCH|nr:uncharacterized protein LOC112178606 [Rosa chinensis]PRQ17769.1 hypothetical protein RchiOBHm_Chr7g0198611 [Rosa chinensis]
MHRGKVQLSSLELSSVTQNKSLKTRRQLSEAKKSAEMNGLRIEVTETSKLQDRSPAESMGDLAPRTEVVLEKHLTENLIEESIATKGHFSPRDPKAELSGKLVGKRLSQQKAGLSDKCETKRSKSEDRGITAESKVAEAVPQKHLTESVVKKCAKTKEDCSPSKLLPNGVSDKLEGKMTIVEVDGSLRDPGKVIFSENDPALTPASNTLNNRNSLMSQMENRNIRRSQVDNRKLKKDKFNLPRRSSKRLAGQQPEPVNNLVSTVQARQVAAIKSSKGDGRQDAGLASDDLENRAPQQLGDALETEVADHTLTEVNSTLQGEPLSKFKRLLEGLELQRSVDSLGSNEQTLQVATRESSRGDASRDAGMASNKFVNGASLQLGASSEPESFFDTLDDIDSISYEESLNKGKMLLDDQVVPKEQHHKLDTEEMDPEKLSFLLREDSSFEFAVKVLTGELPIDYEPILKPAADMVPKATGSCSRNATARSCSSKAIQAVDSAHEASQQFEAIQEKKVADDPCTITNSSLHEESSNEIEKSHGNQAVDVEQLQMSETEKAAVENPQLDFSSLFPDTWSDSDPFFDLAYQSLREDDLFQAYFQENYNQIDGSALPEFGSPSIFQNDMFDPPEEYVPGHLLPMNSSLPPAENVSQPLSMNSSSQPAGIEGFSNGNGVGSDQRLSMNSSFLPAGNVVSSNSSGVGTQKPCFGGKQED